MIRPVDIVAELFDFVLRLRKRRAKKEKQKKDEAESQSGQTPATH